MLQENIIEVPLSKILKQNSLKIEGEQYYFYLYEFNNAMAIVHSKLSLKEIFNKMTEMENISCSYKNKSYIPKYFRDDIKSELSFICFAVDTVIKSDIPRMMYSLKTRTGRIYRITDLNDLNKNKNNQWLSIIGDTKNIKTIDINTLDFFNENKLAA